MVGVNELKHIMITTLLVELLKVIPGKPLYELSKIYGWYRVINTP